MTCLSMPRGRTHLIRVAEHLGVGTHIQLDEVRKMPRYAAKITSSNLENLGRLHLQLSTATAGPGPVVAQRRARPPQSWTEHLSCTTMGMTTPMSRQKAAQFALCVPVSVAKENVHQLGDGLSLRHLPQRLSLHNDGHAHLVQELQL